MATRIENIGRIMAIDCEGYCGEIVRMLGWPKTEEDRKHVLRELLTTDSIPIPGYPPYTHHLEALEGPHTGQHFLVEERQRRNGGA